MICILFCGNWFKNYRSSVADKIQFTGDKSASVVLQTVAGEREPDGVRVHRNDQLSALPHFALIIDAPP